MPCQFVPKPCAFYLFIRAHRNLISSPVCRHHPCMISSFVRALVFAFKARRELALENVALRQQLAVVIRKKRRSRTAGSTFCGAQVGLGSGSCCRLLGCDDVVLCRCLRLGIRPQPGALWPPWRTKHQVPALPQSPFLPAPISSASGMAGPRPVPKLSPFEIDHKSAA